MGRRAIRCANMNK